MNHCHAISFHGCSSVNLITSVWHSNPTSNDEWNSSSSVSLYYVYKGLHVQIRKYLQATDESVDMIVSVFEELSTLAVLTGAGVKYMLKISVMWTQTWFNVKESVGEARYLCELMQHAGQLTGVRTLGVVLFSPASSPVAAPPRLLFPLAGGVGRTARGVGGRAEGGRSAGQEGQDAG